ncbi:MAG TPA: hypothetical protein DEA22_15345, partial [Blastocatellia bacterium]|nr:hypothetical protein [Blastocatellia bacterium]
GNFKRRQRNATGTETRKMINMSAKSAGVCIEFPDYHITSCRKPAFTIDFPFECGNNIRAHKTNAMEEKYEVPNDICNFCVRSWFLQPWQPLERIFIGF